MVIGITIHAAEMAGWQDRVGSIEPGKLLISICHEGRSGGPE
jgi:hypothetical protein